MSDISNRLYECIQASGYSYGELSKLTGIPKSAIQRYATGETEKIPIDRLEKLAEVLHVSSRNLMGWESKKPLVNNDPELTELLESVRDNPDLRMLFSVSKDATPEDIKKTIQIIQMFRDGS